MKISIAMATYNGADYILEQLRSFSDQVRLPDELVVCDDGSTDSTIEIVSEFSRTASFDVRLYQNEMRLGYCQNFCKALTLTNGDIVFLSDQDDVWLKDKLDVVAQQFTKNPNVMVVINNQIIADEGARHSDNTQLDRIEKLELGRDWFVTGCCTALRRPFLDVVIPIPNDFDSHDVWINKLAILLGVRSIIDTPLQLYRRHGNNTSISPVSDLKKPSRMSMLMSYGLRDNSSAWKHNANKMFMYRDRLRDLDARCVGVVSSSDAVKAIKMIEFEAAALEARIDAVSYRRAIRFSKIIKIWSSGGYRQFNGWKSALKDLIRPISKSV